MRDEFLEPPPEMEAFVLAEFDRERRMRFARRWGAIAAAMAAMAMFAWFAPVHKSKKPPLAARLTVAAPVPAPLPLPSVRKVSRRRPAKKPVEDEAEFIQIPYTMPLAPTERASVMRMEMPVSALIAAGLPMLAADTGARAQADIVVGEDGLARAVRVISISSYKE